MKIFHIRIVISNANNKHRDAKRMKDKRDNKDGGRKGMKGNVSVL